MKRIILITSSLVSVLIVTQPLVCARPLEPGLRMIAIGRVSLPLTQTSEPARKTRGELIAAAMTHPAPQYPPLAKAARISGSVEVEVVIDPHGDVIDARAVSGHPLLKEPAVASARQWTFDTAKLSQTPTNVVGTVTIVFDLEADKREKLRLAHPNTEWAANTRICHDEIAKSSHDAKKLGMALANLAVSALDEARVDESLSIFEDAERENKLPADARPYYGKLLFEKHKYGFERRLERNENASPPVDGYLTQALHLFLQAYKTEAEAKPIDPRKLIDIGRWIKHVYDAMGRAEDGIVWMRVMLNSSTLPDIARAAASYELAVALWRAAYDSVNRYVSRNEPVPVVEVPKIREFVDEGYFNIQVAQALERKFANSWFYEKQLVVIELSIETDPEKQKVLLNRAREAQDKFLSVLKEHSIAVDGFATDDRRPYRLGMPSLVVDPTPPPPPPPARPPG
jgi:TonB family protein